MSTIYANVPARLKALDQWGIWIYGDHQRKIPINAQTYKGGRSNDTATWCDFATARKAANGWGRAQGIGWFFHAADGLVGLDLDDCVDPSGALLPYAQEIADALPTYHEISPSGTGVKFWIVGTIPAAYHRKHAPKVEFYSGTGRFFALTGRRLPHAPADVQAVDLAALQQIYDCYRPAKAPAPAPTGLTYRPLDASDLVARAYAQGALKKAREKMEAAGQGTRHHVRYDCAYNLAGFIPYITIDEIIAAVSVNFGPDQRSAEKTILDAIAKGQERPHAIPAPATPTHRSTYRTMRQMRSRI